MRRLQFPFPAENLAEVAVILGDRGVDGDRPADQIDRFIQAATCPARTPSQCNASA